MSHEFSSPSKKMKILTNTFHIPTNLSQIHVPSDYLCRSRSLLHSHLSLGFWFHNFFLIIKPTTCTNFSNLFWNETVHVSDNSFVHHQEFFTVHTAMVYVIQVCRQLSSKILILLASCLQTCMTYTIAVCTVKNSWWWTKELSETCRVSFQNKFEKSVHVVGFFVRICHDARSHERKIHNFC